MAKVLILHDDLPFPLTHGGRLRVHYLSAALLGGNKCFLAAFAVNPEQMDAVSGLGIFEDILLLPLAPENYSFMRHFRLNDARFIRSSNRRYIRHVVSILNNYLERHAIDIAIAGNLHLAEYLEQLSVKKKIVDDFDCHSLTMEREYNVCLNGLSIARKMLYRLALHRIRAQESGLTKWCDLVTTISEPDKKRLVELSKIRKDAVAVIPNGVAPELEAECGEFGEMQNSIAFWGNLSFKPNYSAIQYFYKNIFVPYLAAEGITWYIIGRDADEWISGLAEDHDNIVVTGFIDDLFGFVKRIPVTVNPMIMGSGLKNKVLEAFALKRTVISTAMGVEAIDATPGEHYVLADDPQKFAEAVIYYLGNRGQRKAIGDRARRLVMEKYTWDVVGKQWGEEIERVLKQ